MNPRARRILFSLAVLVWSGVMLYFHASGRINRYLAPDFRPLVLMGGLGLAVLGLFNLLTAGQSAACDHDHGPDGVSHDHESSDLHPLLAFALMVVPVLCATAWTRDEFSAASLARKGLYDSPGDLQTSLIVNIPPLTRELIAQRYPATPDGYHPLSLIELFFATGDREMQGVLEGLKVETEGRWMEERANNPNGTRKRLYRLFLTCCIADSRAIPIVLEYGKQPPEYPENDWVKVAGTMKFQMEDGALQAVLHVDRTLAADPPYEETFLRKNHMLPR
ncbi:MAG: TIGR03943 family protein [Verrucomicrobia bacterium]|nr:TIGR03943 family protein [Verrucomicrobiota bacterium]